MARQRTRASVTQRHADRQLERPAVGLRNVNPWPGLRHSRTLLPEDETGKHRREQHGENQRAQQREATVQAMGLKRRPSTRCSVKIGR